jgi:hypothetical protein
MHPRAKGNQTVVEIPMDWTVAEVVEIHQRGWTTVPVAELEKKSWAGQAKISTEFLLRNTTLH